jgi:hypothetical protein
MPKVPRMAVGGLGPSLFMRDFAMGHIARDVASQFSNLVSYRSNAFFRVMRLIHFKTQLTFVLHFGSLDSCHSFLSLFL